MGDFNRSFTPGVKESAGSNLQLIYNGTKQMNPGQEFDLPVRMKSFNDKRHVTDPEIPSDLVEVKSVTMKDGNVGLDWAVNGNELRIGWNSLTPVDLAASSELVILRLKTTAAFVNDAAIRISLIPNPLNELADEQLNVINDAVLKVDVIAASAI